MTILFVTSIAVIQGKMHVDWRVHKFVVNFTVWLQPFNNSVAAMNYTHTKKKNKTTKPNPYKIPFHERAIFMLGGLYIC